MSQPTQRHATRLLGYPDDARLLIINADDFGMCHAANAAITRSLTAGVVTSTSLMVPLCPGPLRDAVAAAHPNVPFGVHLTAVGDNIAERISELCQCCGRTLGKLRPLCHINREWP